jgi:hypothetical protein
MESVSLTLQGHMVGAAASRDVSGRLAVRRALAVTLLPLEGRTVESSVD